MKKKRFADKKIIENRGVHNVNNGDEERIRATPERAQHDCIQYGERDVWSELGGRGASKSIGDRVQTQRMIDRYLTYHVLTIRQHDAAQRLWDAWHRGRLEAGRAQNYESSISGGNGSWMDHDGAIVARDVVRKAEGAIGRRLWPVVMAIVCDDLPLEQFAARRGMAAHQGTRIETRTLLRLGLDALGDWYGLPD